MPKLYYLFVFSSILACQSKPETKLTIAVAANLQYVIKDLTSEFTNKTGIVANVIIGSSGKLTSQIKQGAPYHVFLSADVEHPNKLYQENYTTYQPWVYACGNLALWSATITDTINLKTLTNSNLQHIAIANPITAPYGIASIEVLEKHQWLATLNHKLVYGESISQVNQFITTKACQIGFTSLSTIRNLNLPNNQWYLIPKQDYHPIQQAMVIINSKDTKIAQKSFHFLQFMKSDIAKEILTLHGYTTTNN